MLEGGSHNRSWVRNSFLAVWGIAEKCIGFGTFEDLPCTAQTKIRSPSESIAALLQRALAEMYVMQPERPQRGVVGDGGASDT